MMIKKNWSPASMLAASAVLTMSMLVQLKAVWALLVALPSFVVVPAAVLLIRPQSALLVVATVFTLVVAPIPRLSVIEIRSRALPIQPAEAGEIDQVRLPPPDG